MVRVGTGLFENVGRHRSKWVPSVFVSCTVHTGVHVKACAHACVMKRDSSLVLDPAPCLRWRHDLEVSPSSPNQSPLTSLPLACSTVFPHREVQSSSRYQREPRVLFQPLRKTRGGGYVSALSMFMLGLQSPAF